jgi:hypothetical protein
LAGRGPGWGHRCRAPTAFVAPVFQADITLIQDLPTVQASVTIAVRGIP